MILNLYSIADDPNTINKNLGSSVTYNIKARRDFDIIRPIIDLKIDDYNEVANMNYCGIMDLNRFYFIEDMTFITSNIIRFNCICDVLETYKDEYLNSVGRIKRGIKTGDYYNAPIDSTVMPTISKHNSNITLVEKETLILSVLGV